MGILSTWRLNIDVAGAFCEGMSLVGSLIQAHDGFSGWSKAKIIDERGDKAVSDMFLIRSFTFLGNRYSSCNLRTRENRLLGIAPNDSPSKTAP